MNFSDVSETIIILASIITGVIVQALAVRRLQKMAKTTQWKWDDVFIRALGKLPILWCTCFGAYVAIFTSDLPSMYVAFNRKLLGTILIISVSIFLARLIGDGIELMSGRRKGRIPSTTLFINGSRWLIYLTGVILVMQNLNIAITPIVTALGIGGLAVALALQDTLSNLFSGIQVIASRLVRVGDYIRLETGFEGYVTDVKTRHTTICSFPDSNRIVVPNSVLAGSIVVNYSMPQENLWIDLVVGVSYDSNLEHVEQVTCDVALDVAKEVEGGIPEHKPVLRYEEFADSSINFRIRIYASKFKDQFALRHEFIKRLHARYREEGIEIPFPIRTIHMPEKQETEA